MSPLNLTRARISAPLLLSTRTALRSPLYMYAPRSVIAQRNLSRLPQGTEANNFMEDPAEDLGGPGGQELYPVSNALHKYGPPFHLPNARYFTFNIHIYIHTQTTPQY